MVKSETGLGINLALRALALTPLGARAEEEFFDDGGDLLHGSQLLRITS